MFRILWNDSVRRVQYAKHVLFSYSAEEIVFFIHRNLLQTGNVDQELSLLVITPTTLRRKIIQRSIFFESDLLLTSGFHQV